jgi:hypothetical protein
MKELLDKVKKASAHPLLSKIHEHTRAQQPVSSRGRWMKVQGRQAHINSSVVVDIAAFKVSHSA